MLFDVSLYIRSLESKLSAAVAERAAALERERALRERILRIRVELAALVTNPDDPDFYAVTENANSADAECLERAYDLTELPAIDAAGTFYERGGRCNSKTAGGTMKIKTRGTQP